MADTIKIEVEGNESLEIKCATCSNGMPLIRGRKFQICDDCLKDLFEIIKERREYSKRRCETNEQRL